MTNAQDLITEYESAQASEEKTDDGSRAPIVHMVYHALGIDPNTIVYNHLNQPRELVKAARDRGVAVTGPDGLLKALTKTVVDTALDLAAHGLE